MSRPHPSHVSKDLDRAAKDDVSALMLVDGLPSGFDTRRLPTSLVKRQRSARSSLGFLVPARLLPEQVMSCKKSRACAQDLLLELQQVVDQQRQLACTDAK